MNNSTVEIQRPDLKLKIVVSVAGMISLIVFAVLFQTVVVYLVAGFGTVAIVGYGLVVRHKTRIRNHEYRRIVATTIIEEEKAEQEKIITRQLYLAAHLHETRTGVFVADGLERWDFIPASAAERKMLGAGDVINGTALPALLDLIQDETCCMIYGGRGAGKTTTALHWLSGRPGDVVVCDPKPSGLNAWPGRVVGTGGRFSEIESAVYQVKAELERRIDSQLLHEPELTLFLDELFQLVDVQQLDVMQPIFEIITIGREYRVNAGFTASDRGVKSLKIDGRSGLRDALTMVRVEKIGNAWRTYVDAGNGEQECKPPGPYRPGRGRAGGSVDLPELAPQWTTFDILAAAFWQEVNAGSSKNAAYSLVFGGTYGGRDVARLNDWKGTSVFAGVLPACLEVAEVPEVGQL